MQVEKRCPKCEQVKSSQLFSQCKVRKDGLQCYCKKCHLKDWNRWYQSLSGEKKARYRKVSNACTNRSKSRSPKAHLNGILVNILKREPDCGLTMRHLLDLYKRQEGKCSVTGVEMTFIKGEGLTATNASVDRIDNELGHEPGNVTLCCYRVNIMRGPMTLVGLREWCHLVVEGEV